MARVLFNGTPSQKYKQSINNNIRSDIDNLSEDELLHANIDELCDEFEAHYYLDIPKLNLVEKRVERTRDARTRELIIALHIPFNGNYTLFGIQPSNRRNLFNPTDFRIVNHELSILLKSDNLYVRNTPESYNQALDDYVEYIEINLENLRKDLEPFNREIRGTARRLIEKEKQRVIDEIKLVEDLGIPLVQRDNAPEIVPIKRKAIITKPSIEKTDNHIRQQILELKQYDSILETIQLMASVLERSPQAFSQMQEEDLRWLFLVALNGHYEIRGQATGETFNYSGKTDILIRINGENVFIAECKIWHGKQELLNALNQLLGYVTWRDTKTAIIIFNRKTNLSTVLNQIPEIVSSHKNYLATIEWGSETQFRYKFVHRDDSNREFYLSVLVFEIP